MFAFLIVAFVILLPIVPAFLLFKALPSTAQVTGPWQGLQLKLGGAFAGYCVVLLIMLQYHSLWIPYEVWQLRGQIVAQEDGSPLEPIDRNDVVTTPPGFQDLGGGQFSLTFTTSVGLGGQEAFPTVGIFHPGYQYITVSLDPANPPPSIALTRDASTKTIFAQKIALTKLPLPYHTNATPLNAQAQAAPGGHQ